MIGKQVMVEALLEKYGKWSDFAVLENANKYPGPTGYFAMIAESALDNVVKEVIPRDIYRAHEEGLIYIHKLPFSIYTPYCTGHSIARVLKKGLKTPTVISRPAKHFDTFVDHIANYLITLQHYFTGAQAFSSVEWYAGPFIRNDRLSFREVEQNIQRLLFNLNYPSRVGLQSPFTNFTVVLNAPQKMLEGDYAIYNGKEVDVLGEYREEAKLFILALTKVLMEGDAIGVPFTFPIPTLMVTAKMLWEDPEIHEAVFRTAAKRGSFYWLNTRVVDPNASFAMCLHENELIIYREDGVLKVDTMKEFLNRGAVETESVEPDGAIWYKAKPGIEVLAFNPETKQVEWKPVKRFLVKKSRKAIRITLSDGRRVIVTPDHPILVMRRDTKKYYLRKAKELLKLKRIRRLKIPIISKVIGGREVTVKGEIDIKVDEEFAYFLGLYYGDGTMIRNKYDAKRFKHKKDKIRDGHYISGLQFSINREEKNIRNFIVSYANNMGWSIREWDDPRYPSVHYIAVYSAKLARTLYDNGVSPFSDEKRVPWFIWASEPTVRLSFIRGLLDSDGYFRVTKNCGCYELHIKNKKLAEDILLLAAISGISAYFREEKDGSVVVYFPTAKDGKFLSHKDTCKHQHSDNGIIWVSIVKVEEIDLKEMTGFIDIEVEEHHYFVHSTGIITHNCCRISIDRNEFKHLNGGGFKLSTRSFRLKDYEEMREEYVKNIEKTRFGGIWAMPDITGSINVTDVNLPRLALMAKGDDTRFWELYERTLYLVKATEDWFRYRYLKLLRTFPNVYSAIIEYLHEFPSSHFNTIGIIGLPEAVAILMQNPKLWHEGSRSDWMRATELMKKMVEFAVKHAREWMMREGVPWNVEEVPGESAAAKLAIKDLKRFPELREYLSDPENPIYSNSIAPYYGALELPDRIEIEAKVQKIFTGGVMMHIFLGEEPDPDALAELTKKLMHTDLVYWSYTPAITHCNKCGATITGLYTTCPKCGSNDVDIWSRIVGYYRPLRNWNPFRKKEFWRRKHVG